MHVNLQELQMGIMLWFTYNIFAISLGYVSHLTPLQLESLLIEGTSTRFWLVMATIFYFLFFSLSFFPSY